MKKGIVAISALLWIALVPILLQGQKPKLVVPVAHTGFISSIDCNADGKIILTASHDNTAKMWDIFTGKLLSSLNGHSKSLSNALFSPDGSKIVTSSDDYTVKLWDSKTGDIIYTLKGHEWNVTHAEFSPPCLSNPEGGKTILSCSNDGTAKVWETNSGQLLHTFNPKAGWMLMAKYSPDGARIAMVTSEDTIYVFDAFTYQLQFKTNNRIENIKSIVFSPDGKTIASYHWDSTASLWNAQTGELKTKLIGHSSTIENLNFSPLGNQIATASNDHTTRIWNAQTGSLEHVLSHTSPVTVIDFSPDGEFLATGSNYKASIWEVSTGDLIKEIDDFKSDPTSIKFNVNSRQLIIGTNNGPTRWVEVYGAGTKFFDGKASILINGEMSPDGNLMLLSTWDNTQIWDVKSGRPLSNLPPLYSGFETHFSHPNSSDPQGGRYIITCPFEAIVQEVKTGIKLSSFYNHNGFVNCANFNHKGNLAVTGGKDLTVRIWDILDGKEYVKIEGFKYTVESVEFSPDDSKILTCSQEKTANVWDSKTGMLLFQLEGHRQGIMQARFSPKGDKIITGSFDGTAKIWDANTGAHLATFAGHTAGIHAVQFSPKCLADPEGGAFIATGSDDYTVKLWNSNTGELINTYTGHTNDIISVHFSPDAQKILIVSEDRTAQFWDIHSYTTQNTMMRMGEVNYFNVLPSGFYQCSQNAAKALHYVTKDLQIVSFEQLDVQYNRPDLVLQSIGNDNNKLVESYQNAYLKRIKKLNIDTHSFSISYNTPKADFTDRNHIQLNQFEDKIELEIEAFGYESPLQSFNVWVNDVPLFGQKGKWIADSSYTTKFTVNIPLSVGENIIETAVTNIHGIQSYRSPLILNHTAVTPVKSNVYFIGIGMNQFQNGNYNLLYSEKDIRDMAMKLKSKYGKSLKTHLLFNEDFTADNLKVIKQILLKSNVNDKVIIAYSGHGLLDENYNYYLSTFNVDFDHPEMNGLPYEELENLLDSIPARQKLMLIDACHSGEVDKDGILNINAVADSMGLSKGSKIRNTAGKSGQLGLTNSFELMQELFVNVSKGTGATIISASAGSQFALERGDLKNGVFTYSILEAMAQYQQITVSELKTIVGKRVVELTNGLQKPTSRNETINSDWRVW